MLKAPNGCKTPKKDREEYSLTASDIRFMAKAADQIDSMLGYYINMAENRTGELTIKDINTEKFDRLVEVMEALVTTLNEVRYVD